MLENKDQFKALTGLDPERIQTAMEAAAKAAAAQTLPRFRTVLSVDNKLQSGFDPVTEADRAAEQAIRAEIARHFPDHDFIGEEFANSARGSDFSWIVDPIDGTRSFITGVPLWGTLIGFAYQGQIVAGLMSQPFIGETFIGLPGTALYKRNGESMALKTSGVTELEKARLFTTTPALFDTPARRAAWTALDERALLTRFGTDCYAYALVAAGHADLVVEAGLNVYDIAALIPIVTAAGGHVATWTGATPDKGGDIVAAASKQLLDQALAVIAGTSDQD